MAEPLKIIPNRVAVADGTMEEWIASHGAGFSLQTIRLSDINQEASLANQARFQALDTEVVLNYAAAMERGDRFPPIVVHAVRGELVVVDGNHRVAAADLAEQPAIDAYVVGNISDQTVQMMTFEANARHGLPSTTDERVAHGLFLIDSGVSVKDAAAMVSVAFNTLMKEAQAARADARLARLNVDRWTSIPRSTRVRLENLRNDSVFRLLGDLTVRAKLTGPEVNDIVSAANKAGTETEAIAIVAKAEAAAATRVKSTAGGRTRMPTSVNRLSRSLAFTDGIDPVELRKASSGYTQTERDAMASRINRSLLVLIEARRAFDGSAA